MTTERQPLLRRMRPEPLVLIALGILAVLLLVFGDLAAEVLEKESQGFDTAILLALREPGDPSLPIGPHKLVNVVIDVTSLGSWPILTLVVLFAAGFLAVAGRWRLALLVVASELLGTVVEKSMKYGFDRPRPEVVPHLVYVHSLSFPSGHAMLSAMTYLSLGVLLSQAQPTARLRIFVFGSSVLVTLLIGMSRVYLGVHWPTDVLAGWAAGAAWALVFWMAARRIG